MKENKTQKLIEKLKKLSSIGVDVSKIQSKDTIKTLALKSEISEEAIIEIGLNPEDKIGQNEASIASSYRGKKRGIPPSEEEKKILEELGINLERKSKIKREKSKNGSMVKDFIEVLKQLISIGIDVRKMKARDTIKTLAQKSGINEEEVIRIGLNPDYEIGQTKKTVQAAYRGTGKYIVPSEEEKKILEELGIGLEREKRPKGRAVQVFIEDIKKLKSIGVDVSKIQSKDTITTLALKSGISEKAIIAIGLNPNDKVGQTRASIAGASRGVGCMTQPTQEEKKILQELGISLERKKKARTGKEIAKASIQALTNIEILEQEEQVLKDLLKREKEEALNKDE